MKSFHTIAFTLLIIGGLNWGLSALGYNVIDKLLGSWPMVTMVIYLLVGVAAVSEIVAHKTLCRNCSAKGM